MAERSARQQRVFTLLVEVGRSADDGFPDAAAGARLLCYAAGADEATAVRETVVVLKQAGLAPLQVTGHGTLAERRAAGGEVDPAEEALMARALAENSVIVAELTPLPARPEAGRAGRARASSQEGPAR